MMSKMDLQKCMMGRFGLIHLAQYKVQWRSVVDAVMKLGFPKKGGGGIVCVWRIFLDHLNGNPLVKRPLCSVQLLLGLTILKLALSLLPLLSLSYCGNILMRVENMAKSASCRL